MAMEKRNGEKKLRGLTNVWGKKKSEWERGKPEEKGSDVGGAYRPPATQPKHIKSAGMETEGSLDRSRTTRASVRKKQNGQVKTHAEGREERVESKPSEKERDGLQWREDQRGSVIVEEKRGRRRKGVHQKLNEVVPGGDEKGAQGDEGAS